MSQALFEALQTLLPPNTASDPANPSLVLANCVQSYLQTSGSPTGLVDQLAGAEVHDAFCACCLHHLKMYTELDQSSTEDLLLSVSHFSKLKSCVEFLVSLGLYPYLDPGVSVPLELRMESSSCYNLPPRSCCTSRELKLLQFAKCMLRLHECHAEQLRRLVSPGMFLGDAIAALLQVGYGCQGATEESREARQLLWKLLCDLPGFVATKELLILQGGSTGTQKVKGAVKLPPAPAWLRKTCGRLLSRLLVRGSASASKSELGVRNLLLASASLAPGVIASPTGSINSLDPRLQPALAQALARILASKPSWLSSAPVSQQTADASSSTTAIDRYFDSIARQVLELLDLPRSTVAPDRGSGSVGLSDCMTESVARFGALVAQTTIHELCSRDAGLGRRLFLRPLLGVLYRAVVSDDGFEQEEEDEEDCATHSTTTDHTTIPDTSDACELASVQQWNRVLDHVYSLLSCPSRSSAVSAELVRLSLPLFHLLMQINADGAEVAASVQVTGTELEDFMSAPASSHGSNEAAASESKSAIVSLLSQLLTVGLGSRASRVFVLRTWLRLRPQRAPSESFTQPLPLRARFRFRQPRSIQVLADADQTDQQDTGHDRSTNYRTPYRCVLTREPLDWLDAHPNGLSALVESAVDVLNAVAPARELSANNDGDDDDQTTPVPSVDVMLRVEAPEGPVAGASTAAAACLPSDLFLSLIADVNENLSRFFSGPADPMAVIFAARSEPTCEATRAALISSALAATMLERMGDRIWPQDPDQLVQLFEMTLDRLSLLIGQADSDEARTFLGETLSQLLGILAFYANQIGPCSSCASSVTRDQFGRLVPILARLERICEHQAPTVLDASQRALLHCLHVLVATRGAVQLNHAGEPITEAAQPDDARQTTSPAVAETQRQQQQQDISPHFDERNRKPLIEELSSHSPSSMPPQSNDPVIGAAGPPDPVLAEAFEQLADPLVPVRGHALIVLSRLLEARDPCVRGHEERIFKELAHQLADPDSYVYLNAIRALCAMGLMLTDRVLHTLLAQFCQPPAQTPTAGDARVELQLKLGEAIMRVLRDLGQMAPKYRTAVLNAMTSGTRSTEPLIRAASLSNLGELCRLLQHAIVPVIYELFNLIELHLVQDPAPCVRQAAANLARVLLIPSTQLDHGLPPWLPPPVLRDLNRLLTSRASIERDPSVCEQIEAALGQLDRCMRDSLFRGPDTPQSLIKEIRVLRPFDE